MLTSSAAAIAVSVTTATTPAAIISTTYRAALTLSSFLVTTVFGELLVFETVVMPGIAKLEDDGQFLRAFQAIDGIIQNNQPVFVSVWIGSVLSLLATAGLGIMAHYTQGLLSIAYSTMSTQLGMLLVGTALYLAGQFTTFAINVPRNNRVKLLSISKMSGRELATERSYFEKTWNKWNLFRTVLFGFAAMDLLTLLLLA